MLSVIVLTPSHPTLYTPSHPHRCSPLGPLLGSAPWHHARTDREHHEGSRWHATCPSIPLWSTALLPPVDQTGEEGRQKQRCVTLFCVCVLLSLSCVHLHLSSLLSHSLPLTAFHLLPLSHSHSGLPSLLSPLSGSLSFFFIPPLPPSCVLSLLSSLVIQPVSYQ